MCELAVIRFDVAFCYILTNLAGKSVSLSVCNRGCG
jgi:hypothetical protein